MTGIERDRLATTCRIRSCDLRDDRRRTGLTERHRTDATQTDYDRQRETPHALMGRISSSVMSVVFFGQLLGLALSGVLAQILGVRAVFFLCAALAWVLTGAGRLLLKAAPHAAPSAA